MLPGTRKIFQLQPEQLSFIAFLILTVNPSFTMGSIYPSRISSGLYEEPQEDPIFYDTFVPIVYNYQYPTWTNIDITLRDWRGLCQTDEFAPSYTCPVFFHLERFIERIQNEIVKQSSKSSIQNITSPIHNITRCNKIQRHFYSLMTSQLSLDQYIESLTACQVQGSHSHGIIQKLIPDYVYNIKNTYRMMVAKFEAEFSTKTGSNDRYGPAYYVNQITASQGIMLFNYWVEHTRWENAIRACSLLERIPTTLVKPGNLTAALNEINENVSRSQSYELAIPPSETSVYMISPLADCTFTNAGSFAVRILVPIKRKSFQPKLIKLQPVPFLLNDNQDTYSICQVFGVQGTYIYDEVSGYLAETTGTGNKCEPGSLCQIENSANIPLPNLCASAYFSSNLIYLKKYCTFQCERVVDSYYPRLPIVRRVSSDIYIITGNENMDISVKCAGKTDTIINPSELGSLEVILPCQCSLNFRSEIFFPEAPCGQNLTITQIIPIHFFNEQYISNNVTNFTGTVGSNMMESKLFTSQNSEANVTSQKIIATQRDLDSGVSMESSVDDIDGQSTNKESAVISVGPSAQRGSLASGVVWLWILFAIQSIIFTGFIFIVSKRLGLLCYGTGTLFPKLGSGPLSFANPLASGSNQNIVESLPARSKRDFEGIDHYENPL